MLGSDMLRGFSSKKHPGKLQILPWRGLCTTCSCKPQPLYRAKHVMSLFSLNFLFTCYLSCIVWSSSLLKFGVFSHFLSCDCLSIHFCIKNLTMLVCTHQRLERTVRIKMGKQCKAAIKLKYKGGSFTSFYCYHYTLRSLWCQRRKFS